MATPRAITLGITMYPGKLLLLLYEVLQMDMRMTRMIIRLNKRCSREKRSGLPVNKWKSVTILCVRITGFFSGIKVRRKRDN